MLLLLFHLIYKLFFMHISENFITKIKKEIWAKMSQTGFQPVGILLLLAVDWIRFAKAFTHGGRGGCYFLALSPSLSLCCTLKRNRNRLSSIPVSEWASHTTRKVSMIQWMWPHCCSEVIRSPRAYPLSLLMINFFNNLIPMTFYCGNFEFLISHISQPAGLCGVIRDFLRFGP